MLGNANTVYDYTSQIQKAQDRNPYNVGASMFASNQERLCSQALAVATLPGAYLQKAVKPPLPQIVTFPPRFGREKIEPGLRDCLMVDRFYTGNFNMLSGGPAGYGGTSGPTLGT